MKQLLLSFIMLFALSSFAQVTPHWVYSTFDNYPLETADTFDNGSALDSGLVHYGRHFHNSFDTAWNSWSGWALSNMTDDTTAGYLNQYSAITARGVSATANYMVAYFDPVITFDEPTSLTGAYFTNSTYAYLDMQNGSAFSKKFGGANGDDEDFFLLKVYCYLKGELKDSSALYLADLRSSDNSKDYILDDWTYVDFNDDPDSDVETDSLVFVLSSSDNGQFGMRTPAYFCMDDFNSLGAGNSYSEGLSMSEEEVYNGSDMAGGFIDQYIFYPNTYTPKWGSFVGWAASSVTDSAGLQGLDLSYVAVAPYTNLDRNNDHYAVSYGVENEIRTPYVNSEMGDNNWLHKTRIPAPWPASFYITNTWYTALDLLNGSNWSKKFGGPDGTDPDYLRVLIHAYDANDSVVNSDTVYLADFRADNSNEDYILTDWHQYVLPNVSANRLVFAMESSDNGQFGMNTPAYFAMSTYLDNAGVQDNVKGPHIKLYPNPANAVLNVTSDTRIASLTIVNMQGQEILNQKAGQVDVSGLTPGVYILRIATDKGIVSQRFIKQ